MKSNRRILLYGKSVILGSIEASLQRYSHFEVTTLTDPLQDSLSFDTETPDIVLFDLEAPQPEAPFFLLKTNPSLVLIGISPGINLVRVWNSQEQRDMSMQELQKLISSAAMDVSDVPVEPLLGNHSNNRDGSNINHISGEIAEKNDF